MSWEDLSRVVAPKVLTDAFDTSERLRALGIPHALVGGLAVGLHGHPRATKDVDPVRPRTSSSEQRRSPR